MDGITHITSVLTSPWIAWIMLALMGCAAFAEWFQPGVIMQAPSSFFARADRTYRESPMNFMGQLLITLFRMGTIAMTLFLCFSPASHASAAAYGLILGGVLAVVLIKIAVNSIVNIVFLLSRRFGSTYELYNDLLTMISMLLYPALLFLIHYGSPLSAKWVAVIAVMIFFLLWIYRYWRVYVSSVMTLVYLMLYFATMEILPVVGLIYYSGKISTVI